ncbi:MAG: hypothetical protein JKY25_12285 [Robiginitomaculum sp.]|nr:hypothetical protein [Robiginitomaculum sp.]
MSGRNIIKSSMIVGVGVVALTLGACASSGSAGSRYGNVYDYESGGNSCSAGASCGAVVAPPVTPYTGAVIGGQAVSPGVIYTDCSRVTNIGCGTSAPVYTQPVQPYIPPAPIHAGPINCPTGTTSAGDGTCMMTGGGSTYTGVTHSTTTSSTVHCPTGTTRANDGTCLMTSTTPSVTIYPTTPHTNTGYRPVDHHQKPVYRPIRK